MIKRLFIISFIIFGAANLYSQNYGNEWINYSQKYYRISIPSTGLYRINYTTLINAGIPLGSINPKNFQLFCKGEEQYINIVDESDNVFNPTDYIEFYAKKNDASFDSLVYTSSSIPNPYVSLYNDTNYVFLTWNNSVNNRRILIETDVNFSSYTPANYVYSEKIQIYKNNYSLGEQFAGDAISDPRYVTGEGYGTIIYKGQSAQTNFGNLNIYQSASLPVYIKTSYSGTSSEYIPGVSYDHQITFDYIDNAGNFVTAHDTVFFGISQFLIRKQLTSNQLKNSSSIKVSSINFPNSGNHNSTIVHYIYLKYPQIPDFSNATEKTFFVDNSVGLKTLLDIQNFNTGSAQSILYDLTNHRYIPTITSGSNVKALIPNSLSQKECFLTTTNNIISVNSLSPVNQTGFYVNYKTTNTDSAFVIVTHKSLQNSANDYKLYKQSVAGGANHVIVADIDDLYDQFAYGNIKNPLSIKNFCRFLSDSLPSPPKYLLLIGKSIKETMVRSNNNWLNCKVPTIGNPPADNLLTSEIHGTHSSVPFIPVGRISAQNDNDVYNYLNKLKSHELGLKMVPPDDWHKHVLHFSGGADILQQQAFESYLKTFGNIIKDTLFGGETFSFQKNSTAPIQIVVSDSVTELINYGASLITFFGHGSVTGFDQAIDNPNAYNNKDKYPLFIANSCYSGDIHLPGSNSTSENFTLIDEKGSIGFLASSSSGVVGGLNFYTNQMYKSLAYETYYKGIGDAIKNTSNKTFLLNQLQQITNLEMTLEGDPSVKLNAFAKPDYAIKNSSISLDPNKYIDSIGISINIRNNGKAITDSFIVKTLRYFPNGDSISYYNKIKAPYNNDTLNFSIYKNFENGIGLNHFKVKIDYYNEISELSETNNSTTGTVDLFISGGDVIPVYPHKYAIVPKTQSSQITLKASTADPFAPNANYKLQLDTNDTFTNPINSAIINSTGGVIEWTVNLPFQDSTVYFWRITKDSVLPTDNIKWRESSFQTIPGKYGWAQAHFHQFKNDGYQFINYLKPQREFKFFNNTISINCRNVYKNSDLYSIQYSLNTTVESNYNFNLNDGWSIAVFDSVSASALTSSVSVPGFSPYQNCLAFAYENRASFDFGPNSFCGANPNWQTHLTTFLNNVPINNYILAYSSNKHLSSTFGPSLLQEFKNFGGYSISTAGDSLPMIIFGKKRLSPFPGCGHEVIGALPSSSIELNDSMVTKWNRGYIESEIIGPSSKWNSLHWKYTAQVTNDSVALKIIGIKANGTIDTIPTTFYKNNFDVLDLYNYIDASVYPTMKLIAFMKDNSFNVAPQLKKWQVIYDPIPECAINPKKGFSNNSSLQAIQEGDNLIVHLPIENIGTEPFNDSLVVTYWIEDANRISHTIPQKLKANPFISGHVIVDTIKFDTHKYPGFNYLWIDVNPETNSRYQLEQYHFNNIARIGFNVSKDNINPLLDVTFDGTHILNGDIVSSKPHILIKLKDENKYLALDDTSNFNVFIKYPNQTTEKRLYFANALQFTPAQLPNNSCKIEWKPEFAEDGKYKLIVQATDRSKNVSGAIDYNIQFEIVNKQTVTEVLNYPNPFSTSTRFVFTLTGNEVPDVFTIQIMTITGKVVKEITKDELGNLHIGRNITEYAWDGKDEFGDKLANGVYLYKVITRHNNEAVEKNQTEADSFFKKGFGKMVIIR